MLAWLSMFSAVALVAIALLVARKRGRKFVLQSKKQSTHRRQPSLLAVLETAASAAFYVALAVFWDVRLPAVVLFFAPCVLLSTKRSRHWAFRTTVRWAWPFSRLYVQLFRLLGGEDVSHAGELEWRVESPGWVRRRAVEALDVLCFPVIIGLASAIRIASGLRSLVIEPLECLKNIPRNLWRNCWVLDLRQAPEGTPGAVRRHTWQAPIKGKLQSHLLPNHVLDVVRPYTFIGRIWREKGAGVLACIMILLYSPVLLFSLAFRMTVKATILFWAPLAFAADWRFEGTVPEYLDRLQLKPAPTLKLVLSLLSFSLFCLKVALLGGVDRVADWLESSGVVAWMTSNRLLVWIWEKIVDVEALPAWQVSLALSSFVYLVICGSSYLPRKFIGDSQAWCLSYTWALRTRLALAAFGWWYVIKTVWPRILRLSMELVSTTLEWIGFEPPL